MLLDIKEYNSPNKYLRFEDLRLIIHWYIRNGSIKKLIKRELRKWNYCLV